MGYDSKRKFAKKTIFKKPVRKIFNVGDVFQPFWVRHSAILSNFFDRDFMERKFNFVLFIGTMFWIVFLLSKI